MTTSISFYWLDDIASAERYVRANPDMAQAILNAEYKRDGGPRWTLIQWLKRHRLHNPTVRVIKTRP